MDKRLFTRWIAGVLRAKGSQVSTHTRGTQPCRKINSAFIPAHGSYAHLLVGMQKQAPGVSCQTSKGTVDEDLVGSGIRAYALGVGDCRRFIKHGVHEIQAKLAVRP